VPGIADLTSVVHRRCYEHAETGEATVTIRNAVAILRLPTEIERDDALAERDVAQRQIDEWKVGLWTIRNEVVSRYGLGGGLG
jgi:hypothetical protein